MSRPKLTYTFVNPNTAEVTADALLKVFLEVNRPKADGTVYPAMGPSLTFDHRAVDGAPAAKFLKELCGALENFDLLLAK